MTWQYGVHEERTRAEPALWVGYKTKEQPSQERMSVEQASAIAGRLTGYRIT